MPPLAGDDVNVADQEILRSTFNFAENWTAAQRELEVQAFLARSQLDELSELFRRAAILVQSPTAFDQPDSPWAVKEQGKPASSPTPEILQWEREELRRELQTYRVPLRAASNPSSVPSTLAQRLKITKDEVMIGVKHYLYQKASVQALVACCCIGAAIQGWDETAVNGGETSAKSVLALLKQDPAQVLYQCELGIHDVKILGLVNGAPYLMSVVSCMLLTEPLNNALGRKGTILFTCFFSFATCLGQAFVNTWPQLLVCRLLLGLGIGPKTATIPIYAAECVPDFVRGAFVMQWQLWDAFGIMLGLATAYIFHDKGATWRLILGSPMIIAAVLFFLMLSAPESPRWHLLQAYLTPEIAADSHDPQARIARERRRKHYDAAFDCFVRLRRTKLQAARDLFRLDCLIKEERSRLSGVWDNLGEDLNKLSMSWIDVFRATSRSSRRKWSKFVTNPRSRQAMLAVLIVMVWQQLCGLNVLAYYSSTIFLGVNPIIPCGTELKNLAQSLRYSFGLGALNFGMALPALFLIDVVGRRYLLLITFPMMSLFFFLAGLSSLAKNQHTQEILVRIFCFLFLAAYSVGEGPIPLVYASESLPLPVRDTGIGIATGIYWGFNFLVAFTWPLLYDTTNSRHLGGFFLYSALCVMGFFLIAMFVPETRRRSLETIDNLFSCSLDDMMKSGKAQILWPFNPGKPFPPFVETEMEDHIQRRGTDRPLETAAESARRQEEGNMRRRIREADEDSVY